MEMSSFVLAIQLLGYVILTHTQLTISVWWFQPTSLKNYGVQVSWDDDIPNWIGKIKNVPNHQPDL